MVSLSASRSSKRTKVLYETDPSSAFVPPVDPVISQMAVNRRKRNRVVDDQQQASVDGMSTTALALATGAPSSTSTATAGGQGRMASSMVLTTVGGDSSQPRSGSGSAIKGKGILVVRYSVGRMRDLFIDHWSVLHVFDAVRNITYPYHFCFFFFVFVAVHLDNVEIEW